MGASEVSYLSPAGAARKRERCSGSTEEARCFSAGGCIISVLFRLVLGQLHVEVAKMKPAGALHARTFWRGRRVICPRCCARCCAQLHVQVLNEPSALSLAAAKVAELAS